MLGRHDIKRLMQILSSAIQLHQLTTIPSPFPLMASRLYWSTSTLSTSLI
jgi:hypothetical protein